MAVKFSLTRSVTAVKNLDNRWRLTNRKISAWTLALLIILGPLFGCSTGRAGSASPGGLTTYGVGPAQGPISIADVAVLDFREQVGQGADSGPMTRCAITGLDCVGGNVAEGSGELVADLFRFYLEDMGLKVSARESVLDTIKKAAPRMAHDYNIGLALEVGRKLGVSAVVTGSVMRFEEKVGTKLAVEKPASVSFSVALIDVKSGRMVWKAKFEKTQQALFDNVLDYQTFFKGGMVWQKAEKLSAIGAQSAVKLMPIRYNRRK